MSGGEVEFGKCDICGKEAILSRKYYHYKHVKCECHGPNHFEMVMHCEGCTPKEPRETKVVFSIDKLKKLVLIDEGEFEHLLNCMCNQKFIFEQSPGIRREWQEIIDKAYHEARRLWCLSIIPKEDAHNG